MSRFACATISSSTSPLEIDRDAATEASPWTSPGVLIGTMGYLSPEQARGRPADARSDIFALGLVLYEMLTGARAFARDSAVETLNAILKEDVPEMKTASGAAPAPLERLVRRCLEKEPAERFQSARDLAFALDAVGTRSDSGTTRALTRDDRGRRRWPRLVGPLAAAALAGAVVTAAGAWLVRPAPPLQVTGGRALATYALPTNWGVQGVSDGEHVYYVAPKADRSAIHRVSAAGGEPVEVPHPFVGTVLVAGFSPGVGAARLRIAQEAEGLGREIDWEETQARTLQFEIAHSCALSALAEGDLDSARRSWEEARRLLPGDPRVRALEARLHGAPPPRATRPPRARARRPPPCAAQPSLKTRRTVPIWTRSPSASGRSPIFSPLT